jgi:hypothetical protein
MEPAVDALVEHVERHVDGFHESTSRMGVDIVPDGAADSEEGR